MKHRLSITAAAVALAVLASPALAQNTNLNRGSSGTSTPPRVTSPTPNPGASSSFERTLPPVQAPSVDNNPNAARGQSLYPPRVTTNPQ